jgi:flagellar assembly protein FliH
MLVIKNGEQTLSYFPLVLPAAVDLAAELPGDMAVSAPIDEAKLEQSHNFGQRLADVAAAETTPDAIVEKARAEAAEIMAEARLRATEIERAARERAASEAREIAEAEAEAEIEPMRAELAQSLELVMALREQVAAVAEYEMVQLAVEIAKKIVRREVTVDREIVISLARVALSRLHNRAVATVRLNPEDYQYVAMHRERLTTAGSINLIADPSITRGGCLVETELGDVDARIEQQFGEIERGFLHDLEG